MKRALGGLVLGLLLAVARAAAEEAPRIEPVEPRVWACDFTSRALGRPMRFLVVLPEGTALTGARVPVVYFLHGRGRHERTLLENPLTRARLLASSCAVVLPRGKEGWYINSPVVPADRFADYIDEVIVLAEEKFPVGRTPQMRAVGGWSMGGYGAVYTAGRRPGDFSVVASLIGILDFPRPAIAEKGQNYAVPERFGTDPEIWKKLNPRLLQPHLRGTPLFVAYADQAPERQMNELFLAEAKVAGLMVEVRRLSGGHTFPMVEQSFPAAFDFLEQRLKAGGSAP